MQTICLGWIDPSTGERHCEAFGLPLTIGRAASNDLVLNDPQVSRQHAILQQEHGQVVISDVQSRNGTFVNGQRIRRVVLAYGTAVQIGSVHLIIEPEYATRVVGGFDRQEDTVHREIFATVPVEQLAQAENRFFATALLPDHELAGGRMAQAMHLPPQENDRTGFRTRWGKGRVTAIVWSPEGRMLAVASTLGVYLHDAQMLDEQQFWPTEMPVEQLAFVEQGSAVVTMSGSAINRWRVQDGAPVGTTITVPSITASAVFAPNGETLVLDVGKELHLYSLSDGQLLRTLPVDVAYPQGGIAFTLDGHILAVAGDGIIQIWNARQGHLVLTVKVGNPDCLNLAISPNGQILAVASESRISVWRMRHTELLYSIELDETAISRIVFAPDGRSIAAITDRVVRVWRATDGVPLRTLRGHAARLVDIAFTPDSEVLAVASAEAIHTWRISDGRLLCTLEGYLDRVKSVAFAPDSQTFAATSGAIRLWYIHDDALVLIHTFNGPAFGVNGVAFTPDSQLLVATSNEQIDLWRVHDGALIQTLPGHSIQSDSVAFTSDGQLLLTVTPKAIELWDMDGGKPRQIRLEGMDRVYDVALASHGQIIATVSSEMIQLWHIISGDLLFSFKAKMDVVGIALDPDGQFLAIASDEAIQLWQPHQREHCYTLEEGAHHLVFSHDGALFASAKGRFIHLWRTSDGTLLRTLRGHTSNVNCLAFARHGQLLISGAQDGTICLWKW